jgi:putative autoinducer-2 (AI-2) aldolase
VDMGRNIFQSDAPVAMIKAVRAVVHQGKSSAEAYQSFLAEKSRKAEPVKKR